MSALVLVSATLLATLPPAQLERESTRAVHQSFERVGRRAPQEDPALAEAARSVAREALRVGSQEAADPTTVSRAVSDTGAVDPHPRALVVRASLREEALKVFRAHPELSTEAAS